MSETPDPLAARRRRILPVLVVLFAVLGAAWWAFDHFVLSQRETTEDAYVVGNQVVVAPLVGGTVLSVTAENTTLVEAGQVLVQLDPADAENALARATAQLAASVRQFRQQQAQAAQGEALARQRRLELERAREDLAQRAPLEREAAISGEELRHARQSVELARQALAQAEQQLQAARVAVAGLALEDSPAVLDARARYREAWIALKRNTVAAPLRGVVAQRNVQPGHRVAPGQQLMQVIPLQDVWVDANFKESQLRNLRIGQPVTLESDLYGDSVEYHGTLVGLAAGTGSAFSLLPPQNASGNWIKVVQRVPVKIRLRHDELAAHPLRIGLSMTATVDTHDRSGAVLPAAPTAKAQALAVALPETAEADREALALVARFDAQAHPGAAAR
jgi:membrane fusion protein (multidrug efflux system)